MTKSNRQAALAILMMLLVIVLIFFNLADQNSEYEVVRGKISEKIIEEIKIQEEYKASYVLFCLKLRFIYKIKEKTYLNTGFSKLRTYIYCGDNIEVEKIFNNYQINDELLVYYKNENPTISYASTIEDYDSRINGLIFTIFFFFIFVYALYCTLSNKIQWKHGDAD